MISCFPQLSTKMTNQPENIKLNGIVQRAKREFNSYKSKTSNNLNKKTSLKNINVNDVITNKFPRSTLKYSKDLVINTSLNRQVPPDKGSDVNNYGRCRGYSARTVPTQWAPHYC